DLFIKKFKNYSLVCFDHSDFYYLNNTNKNIIIRVNKKIEEFSGFKVLRDLEYEGVDRLDYWGAVVELCNSHLNYLEDIVSLIICFYPERSFDFSDFTNSISDCRSAVNRIGLDYSEQ
ncbi:polymerase PA, partial [Alcaligenes faecalis]|uniref:polymerase PA n=1 Tax=Alcaligenes faecalis TaxID=511 RepID=UPI001363404A